MIGKFRRWLLLKQISRLLATFDKIEKSLVAMSLNRQQRKQFWRDFTKDGTFRKDVLEGALKI